MAQGMITRIDEQDGGDGQRILLLYKKNNLLKKIRVLRPDITLDSMELVERLNDGFWSPTSVFVTTDDIIIYDNGIVQFRGDEHKTMQLGEYDAFSLTPNVSKEMNNADITYYIPKECIFEKKKLFTRKIVKYIEPLRYVKRYPYLEYENIRYITQPGVEVITEE